MIRFYEHIARVTGEQLFPSCVHSALSYDFEALLSHQALYALGQMLPAHDPHGNPRYISTLLFPFLLSLHRTFNAATVLLVPTSRQLRFVYVKIGALTFTFVWHRYIPYFRLSGTGRLCPRFTEIFPGAIMSFTHILKASNTSQVIVSG